MGRQKIPQELESEVIERYQAGDTLRQLGESYSCSETSVARILRKCGVARRPKCRRTVLRSGSEGRAQMVQLFLGGATTAEVGLRYGCSSKYITRLLRAEGVSARKPTKIPLGARDCLASAYESGASLNELAKQHGCTQRTVAKALRGVGVEIRRRGNSPSPQDSRLAQRIVTLKRDGGLSQEVIAKRVGCSVQVVSRVLVDHGLAGRACGSEHPFWKGGKALAEDYILTSMSSDHPFASTMRRSNGYVLEHRLVMAEHLGRALTRRETVHHINDNKTDNEIENLQLRKGKHGKHTAYRCLDCGSDNVAAVPL